MIALVGWLARELEHERRTPMDKISIEQTDKELQILLDKYEWFFDTRIEGHSITVYAYEITPEIQSIVPHFLYGHHIKLGFASYLTCGEKYNAVIDLTKEAYTNGKSQTKIGSEDISSIYGR
jgi:hypothetical protein